MRGAVLLGVRPGLAIACFAGSQGWAESPYEVTQEKTMNKLNRMLASSLLMIGTWLSTAAWAVNDLPGGPAVRQLNLPAGATKIAEEQAWLHWFMMIICTVIFIAVFGVMFYSILKHRKSLGYKPATFHESVKVEIAWTVVPFVIRSEEHTSELQSH